MGSIEATESWGKLPPKRTKLKVLLGPGQEIDSPSLTYTIVEPARPLIDDLPAVLDPATLVRAELPVSPQHLSYEFEVDNWGYNPSVVSAHLRFEPE